MRRNPVGLAAAVWVAGIGLVGVMGMANPDKVPVTRVQRMAGQANPKRAGWTGMSAAQAQTLLAGPVETAGGKTVRLPSTRPVLFMAWWCPYCHEALTRLRLSPVLQHLSVVSMWLTAGNPQPPIGNAAAAWTVTERALHRLGVTIPASHLYLAMPDSPINREIRGIPMVMTPYRGAWYQTQGAPAQAADWTPYL